MAASIEDQIHKHFVDQEEERCRAIEDEYADHDKAHGRREKRRKIAKPWRRVGEAALCQEIDVLQLVTECDFDLSEASFQGYCSARGVLSVAGEPGSNRWAFVADFSKGRGAYMRDPYFAYAIEVNGERYKFSEQEMEFGWQLMQLARARLQDCWELYTQERMRTKQ